MDHQYGGQLALGRSGLGQITAHRPGSLRRRILEVFGLQSLVIFRHLLGQGIIRTQACQQSLRRQPTYRKLSCPVQKIPAADPPVRIVVIKIEQFLIEVQSVFSFHFGLPSCDGKGSNTNTPPNDDGVYSLVIDGPTMATCSCVELTATTQNPGKPVLSRPRIVALTPPAMVPKRRQHGI